MPIHCSELNRRQFLGASAALVTLPGTIGAAENVPTNVDQDLVYLLNDTHVGAKHPVNSPVPSHFRQVVEQIRNAKRTPAAVIINGDLALKDGQPGDYRHFAKIIQPLRDHSINLHLTLGNHDHRDIFYQVLKQERPQQPIIKSRHISVVETKQANFFLLDSLLKTMVTQGEIGKQQRAWLADALDARPEKPAIIVTHHNPRLGGDPVHFPGGLIDSLPLWKLIVPRKHVKAYIHGHIHDRSNAMHQGIHIINTPATSYVANPKHSTTGWTTARLKPDGIELTTHTNIGDHPWNGKLLSLNWRS